MRNRSRITMQSCQARSVSSSRHRGNVLFPAALLCALALLSTETAHAVKFTASLDRDTITLGETASLSLKFDGASPDEAPTIPPIANLQITYLGPSSQFSFVNGQTSSSITHNFQVVPRQPGEFMIPAITATVGGQKLSTQPLRLHVLKPNAPAPEAVNAGTQIAFMRLVLPKKEVYLGEPLAAELQIYFRDVVQNFGNFQITAMPTEGLTVGKNVSGQQRRVQIGNSVYTLVPIQLALSPIKTGPLTIGPITANVVVELPSNNRRRDPFFEQFGIRNLFGGSEQRQLALATEAETVRSLPLPKENVPAGFNGAVGSYTMTVAARPTNVAAGDPITVRVQISGRGALDGITLPEQSTWRNFKTYAPTANLETTDALGLQGTKTFEEIVAPENTDIHELPAFSFSFFDPDIRAYRTLTHPPMALTVRPGGTTVMPTFAMTKNAATDTTPPTQDIVHIKPRLGALAQIAPPLAEQTWFIALQSTPVLAFLAALVWRKRTDALANNPRLRRQRQVAKATRDGLQYLHRLAADNESEEFFITLFRLLQEQLGERLDCPATAITEAVVEEKLRPRRVSENALAELHELFQSCNLARYAPVQSSQELAAMVPRLERVLDELQRMKS